MIHKEEVNQGRVSIGHKSIMRGSPDEFALRAMNGILGGTGFQSRLTAKVRSTEGLAYSVGSQFRQGTYWPAAFRCYLQSKSDACAYATRLVHEEIDRLRAAETLERKRRLMRRLLTESGLPDPEHCDDRVRPIVGQQFVDALLAAPDEQAMRELVAERAELVQSLGRRGPLPTGSNGQPVCRDQNQLDVAAVVDAESFVQSIT